MFVFIALQILSFFNYFYNSQSDQGTNPKKFEAFVKRVLGVAAVLFAVGMYAFPRDFEMDCGTAQHTLHSSVELASSAVSIIMLNCA
jgi:hypothetical protein